MSERPRVYKTEGIVLRRRNIGEADSIFTVFCVREGKFDAVAKGVRKARSRMRGHLEPLTHSRMLLAQGRSLDVFTQAETVTPYRAIREDLERSATALYLAELVDRFVPAHEENRLLFELLVSVLDAIESGVSLHIARYFELQLLSLIGYELQLDVCSVCAARLPEEETLLAASVGGFTCSACRSTAPGGRLLSVRAMKVLRYSRTAAALEFSALKIDEALGRELQGAMANIIAYLLEYEPRTRRFIDDVASLPARPNPDETGDVVELNL
jgi:DNA repair protein RecO (recombination protein O)